MENWQKEHIRQNLVELIDNIRCCDKLMNYLISQGCLAKAERYQLSECGLDRQKKAQTLLDIVETRASGYQCLARALYLCKQTGALVSMLYGVEIYCNTNSFKYCGINLDAGQFFHLDVNFGGLTLPLSEICSKTPNIQNLIVENLNVTTFKELTSGSGLVIMLDTIPEPLPYYIPRSIWTRSRLDENFFSEMQNDVFLIEGIEWHALSQLATKHSKKQNKSIQGQLTERSSNQLGGLNVHFILLDYPHHFNKIATNNDINVHWIRYKNGEFYHVKTSGKTGISLVRNFISNSKENIMSQSEFVSSRIETSEQNMVILYDSPGMGKTVLLADLARQVKASNPANVVMWMHCSDFVDPQLTSIDETPTIEDLKKNITKAVTVNKFGRVIFQEFLNDPCHTCYVFLDAFDEISAEEQKRCIRILKRIEECPTNLKLLITSRPHVADSIESISGVLGYNIFPFQETDQVSFLLEYWSQQHSIARNSVLEQFACNCINAFTSAVSSDERRITGIPLQCRMLADIYADDAKSCSVTNSNSSESAWIHPENVVESMFMLFENYFGVKFSLVSSEEKELYLRFHYEHAIKLIFQKTFVNLESVVDLATIYRLGFMELRNGKPTFVHRTFAEYLSAKFVMSVISEESSYDFDGIFQTNIIPAVFRTFEIPYFRFKTFSRLDEIHFWEKTVHFFLNNFLRRNLNNRFSSKVIGRLALEEFMCMSQAALLLNCEYTFEFLISWYACVNVINFESAADRLKLDLSANQFSIIFLSSHYQRMISLAAEYCSARVVEKLCSLLFTISGKKCCELVYNTMSNSLLLSINRGNYQCVEYFINAIGSENLVGLGALHHCLHGSSRDSESTIGSKIQIIKLLLQQHSGFLTEVYEKEHAHLSSRANFKLIKQLIEACAPLNATTYEKENVAHTAAEYCSEKEYHELVNILIAKGYKELFNRRNILGCTPLHLALQRLDIWTETLDLLASKCQVTFNNADREFQSELHKAIASGRSQRVLEDIVRLGGDIKTSYPISALYIAVDADNWSAVNWLLSSGVNVNSCKMMGGQSALVAAVNNNNTEMVKLLISKGANVNVLYCHDSIKDFENQMARIKEADPEIIQMLKSNGARVCSMIPRYCSPCWFCCCVPCARYFGSIFQCVVCCA